ncbi:cupin domain-containing protein [Thalassobaculum sp.]|uniref:helix-turn-helix domain-containing protein n=1 Tax=Thalassobaculum sp. TaxID=2022740 RepID=UPI0032ED9315
MAAPDRIDGITREIGRRLRTARSAAGLTLADLAGRSELSEGFLSRLERGHASASIANLIRLADVLGLGLHELFADPAAPARTEIAVHRGGDAPQEVTSAGYRWRHLAGGAPLDRLEVFHLVFPRREAMPTMVSHPGQEHCYVLSGEVLFHVGNRRHRLGAGDGILIDSALPHRAENAGDGEAHVLMTVSSAAEAPAPVEWWQLPAAGGAHDNEEETR